jgi:hypothetical protein
MAAIKTTAAELKEFFAADWTIKGHEWYLEWIEAIVDGVEVDDIDISELNNNSIIKIMGGEVSSNEDSSIRGSFLLFFNKWKKEKTTVTFAVECDKVDYDAIVAAIKANKGRI